MTEMIMKAMQKAGRNVDASTAEGLLKTFMGMKPGEQKTQRFKEIHDMICKCTGVLQVFAISRFCYFSI